MPAVDNDADMQELSDKVIWQRPSKEHTSHAEITAMNGHEFQRFITGRLQKAAARLGLIVRPAVASHDGGADILIETYEGEIIAIIQCKHSGNSNATTTGSDDIRRAFGSYGLKNGYGIAVTNARASAQDKKWQSENPKKHLLLEGSAAMLPEKIFESII